MVVRRDCAQLQELRHHRRTRTHSKLGKNPPQMCAHRPGTDVEHICNHLVGMSFGHHTDNFLLSWAEPDWTMVRQGHADQRIPLAVNFSIHQDFFRGGSGDTWSGSLV